MVENIRYYCFEMGIGIGKYIDEWDVNYSAEKGKSRGWYKEP